ncbi:MAG: protein-export membrane protein SecF [Candidatus Wildermuthbacteria bacterium RIFCSPHIGHO2_02_FULL_47_12]|uniref:Protein-export membrane protein SecF n=1 Tax=Candidatus Wildermuthbacteria bacterium RIFCSPHIGHO2_02_FULL_47_12 TaxID=1802451 RepID=A0A1G2R2M1_9BACT|nr:MAG: protein-export membrane protein SecF [Candidatus Wildermuthbacteria bacterium RIFCSPHIGHO2_02_FULL_47_12]
MKNIFAFISLFFVAGALASLLVFGLRFGIDLTGGAILEAEYKESRPSMEDVSKSLQDAGLASFTVQPIGERGIVVRLKEIPQETHALILEKLGAKAQENRFESIGPVIGKELRSKTVWFTILSLLLIVMYIAFAFRRTVEYMRPWQWSVSALVSLSHNLLISLGALAALGRFRGMEVDIPIVVALLTVVGYSINDTIVVFDRIRENLMRHRGLDFEDTVQKSVRETFSRSFNTSFTTVLVLLVIVFLGGETLRPFALTLIIGIAAGTYASLFFAPWILKILRRT